MIIEVTEHPPFTATTSRMGKVIAEATSEDSPENAVGLLMYALSDSPWNDDEASEGIDVEIITAGRRAHLKR
jgi:hypothetical protein